MQKIGDFLRRYVMSQEWKVRQMLVLECSSTAQLGETETGDEKNHDEEAGNDALQVEPVLEKQTSGGSTQEAKNKKGQGKNKGKKGKKGKKKKLNDVSNGMDQ